VASPFPAGEGILSPSKGAFTGGRILRQAQDAWACKLTEIQTMLLATPLHRLTNRTTILAVLLLISAAAVSASTFAFEKARLSIDIHPSPLRISVSDQRGRAVCESIAGGFWFRSPEGLWSAITDVEQATQLPEGALLITFKNSLGFRARIRIESGGEGVLRFRFEPIEPAAEVKVELAAGKREAFFGLGEVWNGRLNQRGKQVRMWAKNGTPDECAYVPFLISTVGYGLFVDNYRDGTFDVCATSPDRVSFSFKDRAVDFCVLAGPTPKDIVKRYANLVGKPALPPKWSLMPWKWRDRIESDAEVYADVDGMLKRDIPLGVILVDNPWQRFGMCSFEFDPAIFRDPFRMKEDLLRKGVNLIVWTSPFTSPGVPNFDTAKSRDFLVKGPDGNPMKMGDGYYIDLTNPEAYKWWKNEIKRVIRLGVSGMKLDRGQDISVEARFHDGSTGAEMHNKYALLFCKVVYDAFNEEIPGDFALLPRAGCAGSQSYSPGKWPGDLNADFDPRKGLPSAIVAGLSAGLSGFSTWGSDIGGFGGKPSKNCFLRWAQFGAFCPIMEVVGKNAGDRRNPQHFDAETARIYRYYATLHTELLPYTYSFAVLASETGVPVMRPLFLEYPDDPKTAEQSFEYLYGDSILVAPVLDGSISRHVYLPEGKWFDYWTGKPVYGPTTITGYHCPLDKMPIFIKAGAVIPMIVRNDVTGHGRPKHGTGADATLVIYPSGYSTVGIRDKSSKFVVECKQNAAGIVISSKDIGWPVFLRVKMNSKPKAVRIGEKVIRAVAREEQLDTQSQAWWFDAAQGWTVIKAGKGFGQVRILP